MHSAIAGMSTAAWLEPTQLGGTLARAEALLCALHPGCASLPAYVQRIAGDAGGGGPCTSVWTAGTIAYRCRTCGLSPSAAVCVDCFRVRRALRRGPVLVPPAPRMAALLPLACRRPGRAPAPCPIPSTPGVRPRGPRLHNVHLRRRRLLRLRRRQQLAAQWVLPAPQVRAVAKWGS